MVITKKSLLLFALLFSMACSQKVYEYTWSEDIFSSTEFDVRYLEFDRKVFAKYQLARFQFRLKENYPYNEVIELHGKYWVQIDRNTFKDKSGRLVIPIRFKDRIHSHIFSRFK